MLDKLSKTAIDNILCSQVIGRLACSDGNHAYIAPLTYVYDGENIYGPTTDELQLKVLRKHPEVCFEVDTFLNMTTWQSVVIEGRFFELTDDEAAEAREILCQRAFPLRTSHALHTYGHEAENSTLPAIPEKHYFKIRIGKITGSTEHP